MPVFGVAEIALMTTPTLHVPRSDQVVSVPVALDKRGWSGLRTGDPWITGFDREPGVRILSAAAV
jgi:hypothetical protein